MTPSAALLREAAAAGVLLRLTPARKLKVTGGGSLELLGRLHAHRAELLELLEAEVGAVSPAPPSCPPPPRRGLCREVPVQ